MISRDSKSCWFTRNHITQYSRISYHCEGAGCATRLIAGEQVRAGTSGPPAGKWVVNKCFEQTATSQWTLISGRDTVPLLGVLFINTKSIASRVEDCHAKIDECPMIIFANSPLQKFGQPSGLRDDQQEIVTFTIEARIGQAALRRASRHASEHDTCRTRPTFVRKRVIYNIRRLRYVVCHC
ncbi:uncharacterized protein K489DRAFT_201691 [Dissoconium aciculare CBS 342.82]|uniref:Uncharacterized protein n=1 Tax=Dissoconium aciculare CBS 342.82 TaxID=1314786 RepID=A0A6J3M7S5_9PEZI|nr:uncharacterized protein K489DRAFT_201691 [Dissoconium aciculare CBS 342.82]KAF1823614.1 hypothetical protein K489DRAFT_201691 [Dissoconium aciculare CBS 342.82]